MRRRGTVTKAIDSEMFDSGEQDVGFLKGGVVGDSGVISMPQTISVHTGILDDWSPLQWYLIG